MAQPQRELPVLRRPVEPGQYLAVRYSQRRAEAASVASVGSTGDSYDNALAGAFNSLFKAELVRNNDPWTDIDDLEIAVAEYIDWFNHRRLHGEIGLVPPVEHEDDINPHHTAATTVAASVPSLHRTRGGTGCQPSRRVRACGPVPATGTAARVPVPRAGSPRAEEAPWRSPRQAGRDPPGATRP